MQAASLILKQINYKLFKAMSLLNVNLLIYQIQIFPRTYRYFPFHVASRDSTIQPQITDYKIGSIIHFLEIWWN